MAWHILEKLIEQVGQHSTLIGKFWITFFFVLRFLVLVSISDDVFEDEQEEFVCNTLTPGCQNVCFNEFSPISLIRFWALQILGVSLPSVMFIVYAAHKMAKIEQARKIREQELELKSNEPPEYTPLNEEIRQFADLKPEISSRETQRKSENSKDEEKEKPDDIIAAKLGHDTPPKLFLAYVTQVVCRLSVEILFLILHMNIYVFKFYIPELFRCSRWPCTNTVDCFVSRPKEKTVFLWVMFASSTVMILLSVVELYHLGIRKAYVAWTRRGEDITKKYKHVSHDMPQFGHRHNDYRYRGGFPQAVGIRVGYARSSISGGSNGGYHGDEFI